MTKICKICNLHPFLRGWAEGLTASGLSLRQAAATMREHGIDVSYQAVNRHKRHMSHTERIKRLQRDLERYKERRPSTRATLKRLERERAQLRSWIEAEPNPPREALDALHDLDEKINRLTQAIEMMALAIQLRQSVKLYGHLLR